MCINRNCDYCQESYTASRKTSKFCSTACRVANHRSVKHAKDNFGEIADFIAELSKQLEVKSTCYNAAIDLTSIRKIIDFHFPPNTRWWRCDNCKQAVMKFLPDESSCQCGKLAKWYAQDLIRADRGFLQTPSKKTIQFNLSEILNVSYSLKQSEKHAYETLKET